MSFTKKNDALTKTYEFEDFLEAIKFVNSVAVIAEEQQHHPDIDIRYNKVTVSITTHDQENTVTDKDYELAKHIEKL